MENGEGTDQQRQGFGGTSSRRFILSFSLTGKAVKAREFMDEVLGSSERSNPIGNGINRSAKSFQETKTGLRLGIAWLNQELPPLYLVPSYLLDLFSTPYSVPKEVWYLPGYLGHFFGIGYWVFRIYESVDTASPRVLYSIGDYSVMNTPSSNLLHSLLPASL